MESNGKALATRDPGEILEQVIVKGDLRNLTPQEKASYYKRVCDSIGVNPLTQPFQYIVLNGKETLYATRACTDQLRGTRRLTAHIVSRERIDDVYVVTARVTAPDGRSDESIGAVTIGNLKGDALANALMKAETKAKRRATLSLVGLGWLDETEVETIPSARPEPVVDRRKVIPDTYKPLPAPSAIEQAFPAEPVEGEVIAAEAAVDDDPNAIPAEVREAGPEMVEGYVNIRKSLRGAADMEALRVEWLAATTYLVGLGAPKKVGNACLALLNARKAELSGQTAF